MAGNPPKSENRKSRKGRGYRYGNTYLTTRPGVPGVDDDEVIVIDDDPPPRRRLSRRFTDMSDGHSRAEGGGIVTTDNPDEEMGWARALGSIFGVKPTVRRGYGGGYLPVGGVPFEAD